MTWINTKVEFEWDGEKYVETNAEGYEYEGEIAMAQRGPSRIIPSVTTGPANTQSYRNLSDDAYDRKMKRRQAAQVAAMMRTRDAIKVLKNSKEQQKKMFSGMYDELPFWQKLGFDASNLGNMFEPNSARQDFIGTMMDENQKYSSIKKFQPEDFYSPDIKRFDKQGRAQFDDPYVNELSGLAYDEYDTGTTDARIDELLFQGGYGPDPSP